MTAGNCRFPVQAGLDAVDGNEAAHPPNWISIVNKLVTIRRWNVAISPNFPLREARGHFTALYKW